MKMVTEPQSSDLVDPLFGHSITYPFPRTFTHSKDAPNPTDLESIHNYMKSRALMSPDKLLQEAKAIVDGGMELSDSKFASLVAPENENNNEAVAEKGKEPPPKRKKALASKKALNPKTSDHLEPNVGIDQLQDADDYLLAHGKLETSKNDIQAVAAKGKENTQVRRPGLGRKRARFSLKPNTSQPSISLEPSLDIDQLQDPEEFFSAFEKLEYAKKEIQRQTGSTMTDYNAHNLSANTRRRRPGILGRSVSYKHSYSSVLSENDDTLISSQETLELDIPSSSEYNSQQQQTGSNVKSLEKELDGSRAKPVNRISELCVELLSSNSEISDGDGALSRLQEDLHINPIDLDKLGLPDLHDIRTDFVGLGLGEKSPKTLNTLSYMNRLVKGLNSKTPYKPAQVAESPVDLLTSPTPPKSPFASFSLLKKRLMKSTPLHDPFSALNSDLSPARNPSLVEVVDRQLDQLDTNKELSDNFKLKLLVEDEITNSEVVDIGSQNVIGVVDTLHSVDKSVDENPSELDVDFDIRSSGSHGDLEDHGVSNNMDQRIMNDSAEDILHEAMSHAQPDSGIHGSTRLYTDIRPHGLSEVEENVEDMRQDAAPSGQADTIIEGSTMEVQENASTIMDHALDGSSANCETSPEQQIEKHPRSSLKEKRKARRPREGQVFSRRKSLAVAGSDWESGVRRSSRIKRRPLEYWKGERFLYGRVHQSLPTVIGVKYISPAKGGEKPNFRVNSFVSDDYKELVELVALH